MLFRSLKIGRLAGIDILLHWTMWCLPALILIRSLVLYPADEALVHGGLILAVYVCLLLHETAHVLVARWIDLGLRDITLYPIGGTARLKELSERPWKEIWVAIAGPVVHALIAAAIAVVFVASDASLVPRLDSAQPFLETFFSRLFWVNVLLAVLQVLPVFPMDGGRIFRGALALTALRMRATEVAALLSSFVALLFLLAGMVWLNTVWWLIALGIVVHVAGQQELLRVRFFAALQEQAPPAPASGAIVVPVDQLVDDESRPEEPDFSGYTWNSKNRLWIVWRNGQPVSANALVGE